MSPHDHIDVDVSALTAYAQQLGYYESEADKFGALVGEADVTNEAWGIVGIWAKQGYTDRLAELRSLMTDLKDGVQSLTGKISETAAVYQGLEDDSVIRFGQHDASIDGPR
jgi:hypothetical protein